MKRREILKLAPKPAERNRETLTGEILTVQNLENILIINYWKGRNLIGRYCLDTKSGEYQTYLVEEGRWRQYKLRTLCTGEPYYSYDWYREITFAEIDDEHLARELLASKKRTVFGEIFTEIDMRENDYRQEKRDAKEWRRKQRIEEQMKKVPKLPDGVTPWLFRVTAKQDYMFYRKEEDVWFCSLCRETSTEEALLKELQNQNTSSQDTGKRKKRKILHNDQVICPVCKKHLQSKKRGEPEEKGRLMVVQEMDRETGVVRYFDFYISWSKGKELHLSEAARLIFPRNQLSGKGRGSEVYWNQINRNAGFVYPASFDNRHNPAGRLVGESFLYPEGIAEAFKGSDCEEWSALFSQMARAGLNLHYSQMMAGSGYGLTGMIEYLFKGRFYTLLKESAKGISSFRPGYYGKLNPKGKTEKEVFKITDKQKINRIRQHDGGEMMVDWMRWSEESGGKIDEETLAWLNQENIRRADLAFILDRMSPRQAMNYLKKQKETEYPRMKTERVLEQWVDYLSMCEKQGRDVRDEMVYRPRQLKRRHDELVEEIRKQRILEEMERNHRQQEEYAKKMSDKFPGAEENLRLAREKFSYENGTYRIIVPDRLVDIVKEGNALHHCAGATERYFERIMTKETYICFLRKVEEPEIPFYTIEVEPGGTIRQHRSMYDEEPGIEEIRGFLKEWQKVIKQRMSKEDKHLAKASAAKREQNLEELRQKNNLRVLEGLMQDFMEAM